jgi:hypothetical protein
MNPSRDQWVSKLVLLILITQWLDHNSTELITKNKLMSLRLKLPMTLLI